MKMLIFRSGAYGDNLILTPVIRYLKSQGHELYVVTSKRGMEVFANNPHITRLIQHKEETPIDKLAENIEWLRKKYGCEKVLDFSESIEVALSQHPRSPNYKLSKPERLARFNRNFYKYSFEHAKIADLSGYPVDESYRLDYRPELFFTDPELKAAEARFPHDKFNVLVGMSGSGTNKTWPWTEDLCKRICETHPDVHITTVGDYKCKLIEPEIPGRITNLAGEITMREAMAMTRYAHLVIAPDTGLIHASGCYDTPKICLLGHNTRECITKHFTNDFSVEADTEAAPCAPCLYLIYDKNLQCPTEPYCGGASLCMARGITVDMVYNRFMEVYERFGLVKS